MVRRVPVPDPPSRLALWAKRLALFALAVAGIDVVLVRGGFVDDAFGMLALASALSFAGLALLLALAALVVIWREGRGGLGSALAAGVVSTLLLAYPGYLAARGYKGPALADVSTDGADPPRFLAAIENRTAEPAGTPARDGVNAPARDGAGAVEPLILATSPAEAYAGALEVVNRRKWRVVAARAPGTGRNGQLQAVALTPVMGFREDVVIRVRARGAGAGVDIRSAARMARWDFGSNLDRVRALRAEIEEEIGAQPEAR